MHISAQNAHAIPAAQGLYHPSNERDACGVGVIANIKGEKSHAIVQDGLKILVNLEHRGAVGADPLAGDGAGILVQIPHEFFRSEAVRLGFALPEQGHYGVCQLFLPQDVELRKKCETVVETVLQEQGLPLLGWRDVPVNNAGLPEIVLATEPFQRQVFIGRPSTVDDETLLERRLYLARRVISNRILVEVGSKDINFYPVSMSCRTVVYKGMFLSYQVGTLLP